MSKSIFISHSHKDRKIVNPIVSILKQANIKVWDAEAEINIGDSLIGKIQNVIQEIDYLAVILTKNSCKSPWVLKEVYVALNEEISGRKIKVLPILAEDCKIPPFLKDKLYADVRDKNYSIGLNKLLEQLLYEDYKNYFKKFYPYIYSHPKGNEIINSIEVLHKNNDFPFKMSINEQLIDNPIYRYISQHEKEKLKFDHQFNSENPFRIMPLDLHLVKAYDMHNQPLLLCYYSGMELSGWQTWLFPHRATDKELEIRNRFINHKNDFETLLRLNINSCKISYSKSADYIMSFKPDFGYGGFVLYIFLLCNVKIKNCSDFILKKEFTVPKGNFIRKFKWFTVEELLNDEKILEKNADVIKGLHMIYETSLVKIPISFNEKVE